MLRWAARRGANVAVTLVLVSIIAFLLLELLPGDPAVSIAGEFATPERVEQVRTELGLDEPLVVRYRDFATGALTGDLGQSARVRDGASVWELIAEALPVTASLTLVALAFALIVALPAGYLAARRPNTLVDRSVTVLSAILMAAPPFVLGLLLVSATAVNLGWFPVIGYVSPGDSLSDWLWHLILPGVTLGAVVAAELSRQTRASFVDTFEQDYIRTAKAKGLRRRSVIWKHALKNAAPPILTVTGVQVARIIGGAIVVERIFGMAGIGSLAYNAVAFRDVKLIQGIVLVSAVIVILVNLAVDAFDAYLVPKSRAA